MNYKDFILSLFLSSIKSVHPKNLIPSILNIEKDFLKIENQTFNIPEKIYIFGSGKASIEMAKALEKKLRERIKEGIVVCNYVENLEKISVMQGSHPVPDEKSLKAGE
ncbi:MAG: DUF4147 domain-containing protein, partial [Aquificae bacterium]|nr:DUF4147 domain-containing protein [Aquificota bacterium]